jgi:hypothetical protein
VIFSLRPNSSFKTRFFIDPVSGCIYVSYILFNFISTINPWTRHQLCHKVVTSEIPEMDLYQFLSRPPGGACLPGQEILQKRLIETLACSKNVAIAAHRGRGKTILQKEIGHALMEQNEDVRTFYIGLNEKESPAGFLSRFSRELCRNMSIPPPDKQQGNDPDFKLLDLPEKIAARKKIRLVIFISNFEMTRQYDDYWHVLRKFYLFWKNHERCTYCISSNNQYILKELMHHTTAPMLRFGRAYYLQRNPHVSFTSYIRGLFLNGDKMIDASAAELIASKTNHHLFYLQLLSWHAFIKTDSICTVSIVDEAFTELAYHYEPQIKEVINSLSQHQFNYLRAVLNHTEKICSKESLEQYELGKSSNVARVKQSLIRKGIIEIQTGTVRIVDPIYSYWLKNLT